MLAERSNRQKKKKSIALNRPIRWLLASNLANRKTVGTFPLLLFVHCTKDGCLRHIPQAKKLVVLYPIIQALLLLQHALTDDKIKHPRITLTVRFSRHLPNSTG